MFLLALDLGRTTGYALWAAPDKVAKVGSFKDPDEGYLMLRTLGTPENIVVEKPIVIRGELGNEMAGLIARTESEFGDITYVTAAQWKPHPLIKRIRNTTGNFNPHEKDALCIGAWFIHVHLQGQA